MATHPVLGPAPELAAPDPLPAPRARRRLAAEALRDRAPRPRGARRARRGGDGAGSGRVPVAGARRGPLRRRLRHRPRRGHDVPGPVLLVAVGQRVPLPRLRRPARRSRGADQDRRPRGRVRLGAGDRRLRVARVAAQGARQPGRARSRPLPRRALRRRRVASVAGMPAIEIVQGTVADVPRLEPLWVAVHHVHQESMPELAPYVSDAETWDELRRHYDELFAKPGTELLLALDGGELVGYALSHVLAVGETFIADTWRTGRRTGELESLSVAPSHRGRGIGGALLDAVDA